MPELSPILFRGLSPEDLQSFCSEPGQRELIGIQGIIGCLDRRPWHLYRQFNMVALGVAG